MFYWNSNAGHASLKVKLDHWTDVGDYVCCHRFSMEMVRSVPSPRPDCSLGPREQLNQATSFMDASSVYGSTLKSQMSLRKKGAGKIQWHLSNPPKCLLVDSFEMESTNVFSKLELKELVCVILVLIIKELVYRQVGQVVRIKWN